MEALPLALASLLGAVCAAGQLHELSLVVENLTVGTCSSTHAFHFSAPVASATLRIAAHSTASIRVALPTSSLPAVLAASAWHWHAM